MSSKSIYLIEIYKKYSMKSGFMTKLPRISEIRGHNIPNRVTVISSWNADQWAPRHQMVIL